MSAQSWLKSIESEHVKVYPYVEFINEQNYGEGRFSKVSCADWTCANRKVPLKKLKNYDAEKLVNYFFSYLYMKHLVQ